MVAPASVEKCRRGRPGESKRSNFMTLGYGSFSECMEHEAQGRSRASAVYFGGEESSLQGQICSHVGQAFKTSDMLFDDIRDANMMGQSGVVGGRMEKGLEDIADTLQKATSK